VAIRFSRALCALAVVLVSQACIVAVIGSAPASATTTVSTKTALIYGDSLTWESYWAIQAKFATKKHWIFHNLSFPQSAPCDWLGRLASDLAAYHPTIVAITSAGNVSSCVTDADGNAQAVNTPGYYARYQQDLGAMFSEITATGSKVLFMEAPPFADPDRNAAVPQILGIAKTLAKGYHGVSVSSAINTALSKNGKYTAYKACLPSEAAQNGCLKGQIAVRTLTGVQAGLHLCPIGLPSFPWFCQIYSSGELRFGNALVETIVAPPPPITR
jgi:hypothetical protein